MSLGRVSEGALPDEARRRRCAHRRGRPGGGRGRSDGGPSGLPGLRGGLAGGAAVGSGRCAAGRAARRFRPRRSICAGCGTTHVLLPEDSLVRRRDAVADIGAALAAKAAGSGHRAIAERLGREPAATVRGWLRRFGAHGRADPGALHPMGGGAGPDAGADRAGRFGCSSMRWRRSAWRPRRAVRRLGPLAVALASVGDRRRGCCPTRAAPGRRRRDRSGSPRPSRHQGGDR